MPGAIPPPQVMNAHNFNALALEVASQGVRIASATNEIGALEHAYESLSAEAAAIKRRLHFTQLCFVVTLLLLWLK